MKKCLCFAAVTAGTLLGGTGVASAQEAPPPAGRSPVRPHTVAAGDSLSKIALAELGSTDRWGEIFALNRGTLATPDVIQVGQVLDVPSATGAAPAVAPDQEESPPSNQPPARPHTVAAGESLSGISRAELGASERWVEIFVANRSTIAGPDLLHVGQVLEVPSVPVAIPADLLSNLTTAIATREPTLTPAVRSSGGGGNMAAIRACESSGNYAAVSRDGLYRGAYQFDLSTWQSVGGSGDPAAASSAEQDARAAQLWNQRGSNPWPNCG
jgi:LysM repeat protein